MSLLASSKKFEDLSTANQLDELLSKLGYFSACSGRGWIGEVINNISKEIDLNGLFFLKTDNANDANYRFDISEDEDEDEDEDEMEVFSRYLVFVLDSKKILKAIEDLERLFVFFKNSALSAKIRSFDFDMNEAQEAIREIDNSEYDLAKNNGLSRCLNVDREYTNPYYFLAFLTVVRNLLVEAAHKNLDFIHVVDDFF